MTEVFEVDDLCKDLFYVKKELEYEAATRPGEGPKVESLFLVAAQKIQEATALLKEKEGKQ